MSLTTGAPARPSPARARRWLSAAIALLLAFASVVGMSLAASAATAGITSTILLNGAIYNGTPVVTEGDQITLRVQYNDTVVPGATVVFDLGANVTVSGVPTGNTAIASVTQNGNQVSVTFADPWPSDVNQGVFDLTLTVNPVDHSSEGEVTWKIDGEENSIRVIVRDDGDDFANVTEGYAKSVSPNNLDSFVVVQDGVVSLRPTIAEQVLTYALNLSTPTPLAGFLIRDQLPEGLSYVEDSFAYTQTTWDAHGLNRATSDPESFVPVITGDAFEWTTNLPGPSVTRVTYGAKVTDLDALTSALQAKYDALPGGIGTFETTLTNTAMFGEDGQTRTASVRVRGNVADPNPGPNLGAAFAKDTDWGSRNVETSEDGRLTPAADIVYTLKADLRGWDGTNPNKQLNRNVVISDVLPSQATWVSSAGDFIHADGGLVLTRAASCPEEALAFAEDAFVNQYCVDGQRLLINVGKDAALNANISVRAQVETVVGLEQTGWTSVKGGVPYLLRNTADFFYRDGAPFGRTRDVTVVVLPESEEGINDPSIFTKTGAAEETTVNPGERVIVDYTFVVSAGKGIDARTSRIVDLVDATVFDTSDLTTVAVSGSYDGQELAATDFALSTDADGNLVIELAGSGKAIVTERGQDKEYRVAIKLTTRPFEGKETKEITNKAILFGADDDPDYWSDTDTEATSYGDEAEVRKRVFDRGSEQWVDTLKAQMDGAGNLVQDTYVYRVEFIPHGSYNHVVIVPVQDILPEATEFLGFVTAETAATAEAPTFDPVELGGNLMAAYDSAARTVSITQKDGTLLDSDTAIAAYFAVKVTDASVPVINRIGKTFAEIIPLKSVSVGDYVWVDENRDGRQDADERGIPGVVLTLAGPDGLPVTDVNGNPVGPVTTGPDGEYTFAALPALEGDETYTVHIDRDASADVLRPYTPTTPGIGDRSGDSATWEATTEPGDLHEDGDRDPTLDFGFVTKTYAIGDVVWIDADENGLQDQGETPLAGVTVELLRDGEVVGSTTTDADGRYAFDELAAGNYQVRFTLTDEQKEMYRFTSAEAGTDSARDSDADPGDGLTRIFLLDDSNVALTHDYPHREIWATEGIDPTWDAGVVLVSTPIEPTPTPTPEPTPTPTRTVTPVPTSPVVTPEPTVPAPHTPAASATVAPQLPSTGQESPVMLFGGGALALLAGLIIAVIRTRRTRSVE
jgi:DNA-directed RNA polymerase II subunit RPB1